MGNLIFTFSGIRGIVGKDLSEGIVKKIAFLFGETFEREERKAIIGRDTRSSGSYLEKAVISGLSSANFEIYNTGICPTPVLIFMKNKLNLKAGIMITGSHNSPEWNGLKLIKDDNYLYSSELEDLRKKLTQIQTKSFESVKVENNIKMVNPIPDYLQSLYSHLNVKKIRKKNNLKVVIDTGAGAGNVVTPKMLQDLGCKVKSINDELYVNDVFPRGIEPVTKNLHDLIMEVWQGKYDVGFAHDSDADRLAIVGENGTCYPEDIGLALIMEYMLQNVDHKFKDIFFVTNLASSLIFDLIGEKYGAKVIRTPIGELYLINEMRYLTKTASSSTLIFGGEGSCGGVMYPPFNITRDGIFAVAKIVEILALTGEKMSALVSKLPRYFTYREIIKLENLQVKSIIEKIKAELENEGENIVQINQDLKFGFNKEYFVLIHPSNTEPVIRVISEAKSESLARVYCQTTAELIRLVISNI
jgi:phosphomannomutase